MDISCEPIAVQLNRPPPPEHRSWYLVTIPFGVAGALHKRVIEVHVEFSAIPKKC